MGNNQNASLSDVIIRRNELLEKFFIDCDVPVRIIGDPQKPVFIYDEIAILSMYVHNFDIHFLLTPGGSTVAQVKLRKQHGFDKTKFMDIIAKSEHKAVIKIKIRTCYLCVSGYNFTDRAKGDGRYPVFARYGHKVYFSKKYVDDLVSELNAESYDVESYIPSLARNKSTDGLDIKIQA